MTALWAEKSKGTLRVQLWESELEAFDTEDTKPLCRLVWEVTKISKMRDDEYGSRGCWSLQRTSHLVFIIQWSKEIWLRTLSDTADEGILQIQTAQPRRGGVGGGPRSLTGLSLTGLPSGSVQWLLGSQRLLWTALSTGHQVTFSRHYGSVYQGTAEKCTLKTPKFCRGRLIALKHRCWQPLLMLQQGKSLSFLSLRRIQICLITEALSM